MNYLTIILAFVLLQDIPFKPKEEFEVKLDYQFKQRPLGDPNVVRLGETVKEYEQRSSNVVLPYLILNVKMLRLEEEKMRLRVTTNLSDRTLSKKVSSNDVVELDLGFTDDMIDRVTAHEYTLTFSNSAKMPVDKILINVDADGSFFVNGEKRGKF